MLSSLLKLAVFIALGQSGLFRSSKPRGCLFLLIVKDVGSLFVLFELQSHGRVLLVKTGPTPGVQSTVFEQDLEAVSHARTQWNHSLSVSCKTKHT